MTLTSGLSSMQCLATCDIFAVAKHMEVRNCQPTASGLPRAAEGEHPSTWGQRQGRPWEWIGPLTSSRQKPTFARRHPGPKESSSCPSRRTCSQVETKEYPTTHKQHRDGGHSQTQRPDPLGKSLLKKRNCQKQMRGKVRTAGEGERGFHCMSSSTPRATGAGGR